MKITVIAPFPPQKDGIPRVAEELLKRIAHADDVDEVSVLARQGMDFITPALLVNRKVSLFSIARFLTPQTMVKLIRLYKESDVVLFLAPPWDVLDPLEALYFFLLLIKYGFLPRTRWVQVVHDFIPYIFSDDGIQGRRTIRLFNTFQKHFSDVPEKYIAVSQSTKNDAMRFWGLQADRIAVIHHGPFVAPKPARNEFGSNKVLIVSDISPRKNHLRLIKAFELVKKQSKNPLELVIAGYMRTATPELKAILRDVKGGHKNNGITLAGYLPDSHILALYEQADVFVYPSLYEGFGLPVLEAMACGCPVIASNVSSLPEVVGEAALLVDPYDVEAMANAMLTVLEDDELKKEMSRKGVAQARKFSWEKAGDELLTVCREVAQKAGQNTS
ncbi:MAG TPA: glycosyltransferase family 1 protein [Candidatus Bathyarchaeia archaeon]|nr:glycosyltransferase family 1 protein [Candidatus Bathyarchaeia archaeon]